MSYTVRRTTLATQPHSAQRGRAKVAHWRRYESGGSPEVASVIQVRSCQSPLGCGDAQTALEVSQRLLLRAA